MRTRPLTALIVSACLLLTMGGAQAASKPKPKPKPPPCRALVDPAGDTPSTRPGGTTGPLYDPNLDVLSADIANDAKYVTAVIRLAKLEQSDSKAPTGRVYFVDWAYASGRGASLRLRVTPTLVLPYPAKATATLDYAHAEIRITAPLEGLDGHALFAKGDSMIWSVTTDLTAPATTPLPVDFLNQSPELTFHGLGDSSTALKAYPLYAPSCVKPGP